MSIAKEIQFQLEAALGVEPEISAVIKALHTNVTGQFETEHGLSDAFSPWIEARARATRDRRVEGEDADSNGTMGGVQVRERIRSHERRKRAGATAILRGRRLIHH